jgi:hypothetical protein
MNAVADAEWYTDYALMERLGEWWLYSEDMDLSGGGGFEGMKHLLLEWANEALAKRGYTWRVIDVRENDAEAALDWLLV